MIIIIIIVVIIVIIYIIQNYIRIILEFCIKNCSLHNICTCIYSFIHENS